MKKIKKVVLAYSGGLDTSVMIRWLIENYQCEVVAFSADLGQGPEMEIIRKKAIATGASKIYIKDLREEFVEDFIWPALKTNAMYEGKYPLATALGRPLISKHLVEIAKKEKADAIAHGSTGKGNDQVRFEVTAMTLAPEIERLAPVRDWELKTRSEEIDYAKKHKIPVPVTKKSPYSIDLNLWGRSMESGVLEDPWVEPPEEIYELTVNPAKAPKNPTYVEIGFEKGIPVSLNGKKMKGVKLIETLNEIAGKNGVGRIDMVENRLVGIKSRENYEAPAAVVLLAAHRELEALTLDRETLHFKEMLTQKYSELIYFGLWYTPLRYAIDAFVNTTQENVTGVVKVRLQQGNCVPVSRKSPFSQYQMALATYEEGDMFDQKLSKGFVELWGLPSMIAAKTHKPRK
jgi:argininosuccinate synthase